MNFCYDSESDNTQLMMGSSTFIVFGSPFSGAQVLFRPISKPELFVKWILFCIGMNGLPIELFMSVLQFPYGGLQEMLAYFLVITDSSSIWYARSYGLNNKAACNKICIN